MPKIKKERKPYRISSVAEAYTADAQIMPTLEEIRRAFGPARTLGAPENVVTACDAQLEATGAYTLLQHSFDLGQFPQTSFLGYSTLQQISQNGMVRACIETVADDIMRNFIELKREGQSDKEPDKKDDSEQEFARILAEALGEEDKPAEKDDAADESLNRLDEELRALSIRQVLHEAVTLVGYMGGALVFIDTGEVDPEILKMPLNISRASAELKKERRLRFVAIDPINVFPGTYNSISPLRPDYYKPRSWWVMGQEIHASRFIRLVANEVPTILKPSYNFMGIAQAQILWDYVMHFETNRDAVNRMLNKFSLTVMKTDMSEVLTQAGGLDELNKRINLLVRFRSNDGVQLIDKEAEDILKLETPIGGMTDVVRQSLEILAGINRTPAVKLLGISPSGFNATGQSDIRNYYDHIASQQNKILRGAIEKILDILQIRLFGEIDKTITFDFVPLGEEDKASQASTQKTIADTMAVLLDRQIVSPEECRKVLADDPDSGFADIDVDELPDPPQQEGMQEQMAGLGAMLGGQEKPAAPIDDVDKAGMVGDSAATKSEMTNSEYAAFMNYTHGDIPGGYSDINKGLRYGKSMSETAKRNIREMDRFFSRHGGNIDPLTLYRGFLTQEDVASFLGREKFFRLQQDFKNGIIDVGDSVPYLVGVQVVDDGYVSACEDKRKVNTGVARAKINIPVLSKAVRIGEEEILLDRGSRFHVASVKVVGGMPEEPRLEMALTMDEENFSDDGLAKDARWITVHPNGDDEEGQPVLVEGENYTIKGGMGGKFNGQTMSQVKQASQQKKEMKQAEPQTKLIAPTKPKEQQKQPEPQPAPQPQQTDKEKDIQQIAKETEARVSAIKIEPGKTTQEYQEDLKKLLPDGHFMLEGVPDNNAEGIVQAIHSSLMEYPELASEIHRISTVENMKRWGEKKAEKLMQDTNFKESQKPRVDYALKILGATDFNSDAEFSFSAPMGCLPHGLSEEDLKKVYQKEWVGKTPEERKKWFRRFVEGCVYKEAALTEVIGSVAHVDGDDGGAVAFTSPGKGIFLTKSFSANDFKKDYDFAVFLGESPAGTQLTPAKSVFTHEIGHKLDYLVDASKDPQINQMYEEYNNTGKLKNGLSSYACTNVKEMIADAFCEKYCSKKPRPISKKIMKRVDELYKAKFHPEKLQKKGK